MTTPQNDITAAARTLGRKGGKIDGRPVRYFGAGTITPALLRRVAAMAAASSDSLSHIARDADDGAIDPATAARAANLALRDLIRATNQANP